MRLGAALPLLFVAFVCSVYSSPVLAQTTVDAEIDTDIDFYSDSVEAECWLRVGKGEPYISYNGDCRHRRTKNNVTQTVDLVPGSNVPINFPSSGDYTRYIYTENYNAPATSDEIHCSVFGWEEGGPGAQRYVILGHATNVAENFYIPESSNCDSYSPPPPVKLAGSRLRGGSKSTARMMPSGPR